MAKKKTAAKAAAKVEVAQPEVKATNEMTQVVIEKPKAKETQKHNNWEIKDRIYYLKGNKKPVSRSIKAARIYWFDEEKGYERELKYCDLTFDRTSLIF